MAKRIQVTTQRPFFIKHSVEDRRYQFFLVFLVDFERSKNLSFEICSAGRLKKIFSFIRSSFDVPRR